jgi:hypothetical protein
MEGNGMSDVFRKFASVATPEKYGYAFDSDSWRPSATGYDVESKFRVFETCGDGLTQHSGDWAVTYDFLDDYLISLSVYMLAHKEDTDLFERVGYIVLNGPRREVVKFAASVVWNEKDEPFGKTRYYSTSEQKITRNQEKRHDKRYKEIDKYLDGSPKSIYTVLMADKEYADGMERLCYAFAIKRYVDADTHLWMDSPTNLLGWWNEDPNARDKRQALGYGFRAIQSLARFHQEMKVSEGEVGNYLRNVQRKPEAEIEKSLALTDGAVETAA